MTSLRVYKGLLQSVIQVPPSKSYANRLLILAALKSTPFIIHNLPMAEDVQFLVQCLNKLGLAITKNSNSVTVTGSFPACESEDLSLDVGEGGTTARFLACLLTLGKKHYRLNLGERLSQRPWAEFIDLVNAHGGKASLEGRVLNVQGPLEFESTLNIDCARTSQFASGFLLAYGKGMKIYPQNLRSSESYWEMSKALLREIDLNSDYSVPLDWSSASYPMVFAALNQTIELPGLKADSFQADAKLLKVLAKLGAIKDTFQGLKVNQLTHPQALEIDVNDCLDLVPSLAFLLAHIEGKHLLKGVSNLVHKESDRLAQVQNLLSTFKRKSGRRGSDLWIEGRSERLDEQVDLTMPNDHRMVMAATLFLRHHGGGTVGPAEAVKKSYPAFFDLLT